MAKAKKNKPYFDASTVSLGEWLSMVFTHEHKRKFRFVDYHFPTDSHALEYLINIETRSDFEVKHLIPSFLIPPGIQGHDHQFFHHWKALATLSMLCALSSLLADFLEKKAGKV